MVSKVIPVLLLLLQTNRADVDGALLRPGRLTDK
jgi:ATP-dependent 26S proteasome regulatory subunit